MGLLHTRETEPPAGLSSFVLSRLHIEIALGTHRHTLPAYLGSTLRGTFGMAFRDLVCVTQVPVCDGCVLLQRCPYPYVFETPPPIHFPIVLQKRFRHAPRPYIFDVPPRYAGEATLTLGLILVGQGRDFLPYFLLVLQEIGRRGLGQMRVPYRLVAVTDGSVPEGGVVFRPETGIVQETVRAVTLADMQHPADAQVRQVTLTFLTPLRLKKYGGYQSDSQRITFATLLDLLLGRLEALAMFHCGAAWQPDQTLRHAAQHVQIVAQHLTLQRLTRYSNRRQKTLPLHGLVGSMSFAGDLSPFLPLLRLGTYVHLGAGTAFGLGQYRLDTVSEESSARP